MDIERQNFMKEVEMAEFRKQFFEERDDTGRYMIVSYRTGVKYYIEPIGPDRAADWGSYNPSTGKVENKKGFDKHRGAIDEEDSLIKGNGFKKIYYSGIGTSPEGLIAQRDAQYPSKQ